MPLPKIVVLDPLYNDSLLLGWRANLLRVHDPSWSLQVGSRAFLFLFSSPSTFDSQMAWFIWPSDYSIQWLQFKLHPEISFRKSYSTITGKESNRPQDMTVGNILEQKRKLASPCCTLLILLPKFHPAISDIVPLLLCKLISTITWIKWARLILRFLKN